MEIKFENGSKIETIEPKSKDYKRGNAFPVCFLEDSFEREKKMRFYNMCEGSVYSTLGQYIGELTKELDKLSGRQEDDYMKTHCYIRKISNYKITGLFSFYVLPTIEVYKDDVFDESYFEVSFCWLFFAITLYFDKD